MQAYARAHIHTYTYTSKATDDVTNEAQKRRGQAPAPAPAVELSRVELKQPGQRGKRQEADEENAPTWSEAAEPRKVEDSFPSFTVPSR